MRYAVRSTFVVRLPSSSGGLIAQANGKRIGIRQAASGRKASAIGLCPKLQFVSRMGEILLAQTHS